MTYPDKMTYKTTVTRLLRDQIASFGTPTSRYLEIGCDVGYTTRSVAPFFEACLGIDIAPDRIDRASVEGVKNCEFVVGDSTSIPRGRWDVVLIDADHSYASVKSDFDNVVSAISPGTTRIIFHDYGLVSAGVKRFVSEFGDNVQFVGMKSGWNPLGQQTDDYEAAMIQLVIR